MSDNPGRLWWSAHNFVAGRPLDDRYWLCVGRMIFTWRVMVCDEITVEDFCCFNSLFDAMHCYGEWDGTGLPPGDWNRHHRSGLRRQNGQLTDDYGRPIQFESGP